MNEKIQKLLSRRGVAADKMKEMLALAETESRNLTEDEATAFDALDKEIVDADAMIKREERTIEVNKKTAKPFNAPKEEQEREEEVDPAEQYRAAFWKGLTKQVLSTDEARSLNTGTDSKGGYLVPETFVTTIIEALAEKSYMRRVATVSSSTSLEKIPVEGDDGANGWIDEEGTYPESDPTIGQVIMDAYKTGRIIKVTEEQLQDSFTNIESYIAKKFAKSTIAAEEVAFVSGNGTGKPTGVLVTASVGVTAAGAAAITSDEILELYYSLDEDYASNGTWMFNRNTEKAIRTLKDGNGDYLWAKGFDGAPATILGRPVVVNKNFPDIGTGEKPIAFGDFSYYFIKDRKSMAMKRMDELYSTTGHIGYRVDKRVDGKLVLADAVKTLVNA